LGIQWVTSSTIGDDLIGDLLGYSDPIRKSNLTHEGCIAKFGKKLMQGNSTPEEAAKKIE